MRAVVDTIGNEQAAKQLSSLRTNDRQQLDTIITLAARGGDLEMFHVVLRALRRTLTKRQIADVLDARGDDGTSLLTAAVEGGSQAVFDEVLDLMGGENKVWAGISTGEARCVMNMAGKSGNAGVFRKATEALLLGGKRTSSHLSDIYEQPNETSVLVEAARSGTGAMVDAVVATLSDLLTEERVFIEFTSCAGPRGMSALMVAAERGNVEVVQAVMRAVSPTRVGTKATLHKIKRKMVTAKDTLGMTALYYATNSGVMEVITIVSALMVRYLPASQMQEEYSSSFATCCGNLPMPVGVELLEVISYLLEHGAKPETFGLIRLSTRVQFGSLKESLLRAVSSANNPFIPGMNLSVALAVAARSAMEGEKRPLLMMQGAVDQLLVEVLEHMPQTVGGFKGTMDACSAMFEPETVMLTHKGTMGPLSVALQKRQQMDTYCTIPLVVDFMWRKFTKGLPNLKETAAALERRNALLGPGQTLYGDGLHDSSRILILGRTVQNGYGKSKLSTITYFPGARFVIVGMLTRPDSYYKVPALRMVLDFVTYLCIMGVFGGFVLLNEDNTFDWAEIVFAFYICGAIMTEFAELVEDPWEYVLHGWRVLDVASICLMSVSVCFHAFSSVDTTVVRSLYALSTPLAFTRILFYAQVLPSQAPRIQVLFSVTHQLVRFGAVMLVMMIGFVTAFYSFFQANMTYGEVWLNVFRAMLGDTIVFDEFSGGDFDNVPTALLKTYLVLLTIIMVNLLVAVLSTSHTRIDRNADQVYKVSKARVIRHYVSAVELHRLPAPFNLLQWVFCSPMLIVDRCFSTRLHKGTKHFVGPAVFWAMLGPIVVAAGWLLWVVSVPKAVPLVWRTSAGNKYGGQIAMVCMTAVGCTVVAPFWLSVIWVKGGLTSMCVVVNRLKYEGRRMCRRGGDRGNGGGTARSLSLSDHDDTTQRLGDELEDVVMSTLNEADRGLGIGDLQRYLDDPMSDPYVRRDEQSRTTTVEHVKLLRNRLEATTKEHINELQSYLIRATGDISRNVKDASSVTAGDIDRGNRIGMRPSEIDDIISYSFSELERSLDARTTKLEARIGVLIDERLGVLEQKLERFLLEAVE